MGSQSAGVSLDLVRPPARGNKHTEVPRQYDRSMFLRSLQNDSASVRTIISYLRVGAVHDGQPEGHPGSWTRLTEYYFHSKLPNILQIWFLNRCISRRESPGVLTFPNAFWIAYRLHKDLVKRVCSAEFRCCFLIRHEGVGLIFETWRSLLGHRNKKDCYQMLPCPGYSAYIISRLAH